MLLGVISDTHGLLRPEAVEALRGAQQVIHAGDVGSPEILKKLTTIAPVTAVRGNVDKDAWAQQLPQTQVLEAGGISIYLLHDLTQLDVKPEAAGFRVVISGHSHIPKQEVRNGVLYFNPGSAGPRRFKGPVSVGRLSIDGAEVSAELVILNV
jgi:putative phosphoesterase